MIIVCFEYSLIFLYISTVEHALRLCATTEDQDDIFVAPGSDIEMDDNPHEIKNDNSESSASGPIAVNTLVAALTLTGEGSEEWILARIKAFDGKLYTVEDAEVEEEASVEIVQKEYSIIK